MNSKHFLRHHLKPQRLKHHASRHLPAVAVVLLLLAFTLGLAWLPGLLHPVSGLPKTVLTDVLPTSPPNSVPQISARHVFIQNLDTGAVVYQKSADEHIYPASTTKIVTALVALDYYPLDRIITVTKSYPEGEDLGLVAGEQFSVEKLLYALLVQSANDVAEILAENMVGGRPAFITAMNTKVTQLGLLNTHFVNPHGLDEVNHYSSASDLGRLAAYAMKNPLFSRIVSTENSVISSHILTNTNQLLGKVPGLLGVKTGFTDLAGQSLISVVDRDNLRFLIVVLGSQDRFGDTRNLIDWIYSTAPSPEPLPVRNQ